MIDPEQGDMPTPRKAHDCSQKGNEMQDSTPGPTSPQDGAKEFIIDGKPVWISGKDYAKMNDMAEEYMDARVIEKVHKGEIVIPPFTPVNDNYKEIAKEVDRIHQEMYDNLGIPESRIGTEFPFREISDTCELPIEGSIFDNVVPEFDTDKFFRIMNSSGYLIAHPNESSEPMVFDNTDEQPKDGHDAYGFPIED